MTVEAALAATYAKSHLTDWPAARRFDYLLKGENTVRFRPFLSAVSCFAFWMFTSCAAEGSTAPNAELPRIGGPRLEIKPISSETWDYLSGLAQEYLDQNGWTGPCAEALLTFFDRVTVEYEDVDHDSWGVYNPLNGSIGINKQRLGLDIEDLDTMFHEGYHANTNDLNDQNAANFAASCQY